MTGFNALLRAVISAPDDDTVRLAIADWYNENGQPERAEFIRVQVKLARLPSCFQDELTDGTAVDGLQSPQGVALLAREQELRRGWDADKLPWPNAEWVWHRGFVSHVTCTAADWLKHADAIYWEPGQTVKEEQWKFIKNRFGGTELGCFYIDVPRPCPPTAQPIERVTLTRSSFADNLPAEGSMVFWNEKTQRHSFKDRRWPSIEFELPQPNYEEFRRRMNNEIARGLGVPNPDA